MIADVFHGHALASQIREGQPEWCDLYHSRSCAGRDTVRTAAVETEPAPIEELKTEPIVAETPENTETPVEVAEVLPIPPVAAPALPKTASDVPLIALLGALSLTSAFILRRLARSTS